MGAAGVELGYEAKRTMDFSTGVASNEARFKTPFVPPGEVGIKVGPSASM